MKSLPWRSGAAIFAASVAVTAIFVINVCDWIYDCGCRSWWAGAVDYCNIHDPNSRHCPWCSVGDLGFAAVFLGIAIPQAVLSVFPQGWKWPYRLLAALAAFPVAGWAIGLAMGWWMGYWE